MSLLLFTTVWLQCLINLMLRVFFPPLIINIWLLKMKVGSGCLYYLSSVKSLWLRGKDNAAEHMPRRSVRSQALS